MRLPRPLVAVAALAAIGCGLRLPGDAQGGRVAPPTSSATDGGTNGSAGTVVATEPDAQSLTHAPEHTPPRSPSLAEQLGEDRTAAQLDVPAAPPATGTWRFMSEEAPGTPVTFDACRPIHYRVRIGPGPPGAEAIVTEAIARMSAATGLRFVFDGYQQDAPTTASYPTAGTSSVLAAFEPVVIGWAAPAETDLWASEGPDTLGVGGPRTIVFGNGERLAVSGFALLAPNDALAPDFGPGLTVGNVLLHELGHLAGLDHVEDADEIMQARFDRAAPDGWGPGDRRGLWELGASRGCASSYLHLG